MDILDVMKERRSIRKYQDKQISREDLEKIIEAGLYAPNAGGVNISLLQHHRYAIKHHRYAGKHRLTTIHR